MLFNSIEFAFFLPIVFCLFWLFNKNLNLQNGILLLSSYYFYSCWDWRFLSLILFSTIVDYCVGLGLKNESHSVSKRKLLLWISISVNIGLLGFFKYYNFFIDQFTTAFTLFGTSFEGSSINIILPVGISFYTFQTMSYTIDAYRKKIEPTTNLLAFSAFVSFFPQLVAGPIERASSFLPQFIKKKQFDYTTAVDGMRQILWGLFKKMIIADNCAEIANTIFNSPADHSASTLVLGAVFFAFQIYGDFSGYSDIAIGTARLFGFNLMKNFSFPYFSRDIAEFWRRWHISLSSWFRDYVYIPLGGSKASKTKQIRNVFIVFIVSGFWHGANWTFIIWGALNALFFLPLLLFKKNRTHLDTVAQGKFFPTFRELIAMVSTFLLSTMTWIFFRAESIYHAKEYFQYMFDWSLFSAQNTLSKSQLKITALLLMFFLLIEWLGRENEYAIERIDRLNKIQRWSFYAFLLALIGSCMPTSQNPFIYFQF
ncbi:MBOAT family protein [bacterium]|nr:MBOAT family protein [bacterium]